MLGKCSGLMVVVLTVAHFATTFLLSWVICLGHTEGQVYAGISFFLYGPPAHDSGGEGKNLATGRFPFFLPEFLLADWPNMLKKFFMAALPHAPDLYYKISYPILRLLGQCTCLCLRSFSSLNAPLFQIQRSMPFWWNVVTGDFAWPFNLHRCINKAYRTWYGTLNMPFNSRINPVI